MDEKIWSQALRCRDHQRIEQLLKQYGGMMGYIVRGILSDPHEVEECLSRIHAKLWEKIPTYNGEKAALSTWITAICRNTAYDRLRELQRQSDRNAALEDQQTDPTPGPEELLLQQERREQLQKSLCQLKESDRRLFYRKYYYLQSTAQIASELGTSQRAVEGRLYRIRKQLQKQLGGDAL